MDRQNEDCPSVAGSVGPESLAWSDPSSTNIPLTCNPLLTYIEPPQNIHYPTSQLWMHPTLPTTSPVWQDGPLIIDPVHASEFAAPIRLPDPPPIANMPQMDLSSTATYSQATVPLSETYSGQHSIWSEGAHGLRSHPTAPTAPNAMSIEQIQDVSSGQHTVQYPASVLSALYPPRPRIVTFEAPFECKLPGRFDCECSGVIEPTYDDVRYHFKKVHQLRGAMQCPWPADVCPDKDLLEGQALYRHILRKHGHCYMHRCLQCGQELPAGTSLRQAEGHAAHCQGANQGATIAEEETFHRAAGNNAFNVGWPTKFQH